MAKNDIGALKKGKTKDNISLDQYQRRQINKTPPVDAAVSPFCGARIGSTFIQVTVATTVLLKDHALSPIFHLPTVNLTKVTRIKEPDVEWCQNETSSSGFPQYGNAAE